MSDEPTRRGRIAGIDFGTRRIGIALTDPGGTIASPHENYTRRTPEADAERMRQLVQQEEIVRFVVGLPLHMSGDESEKSRQARRFGKWLAETTGVSVDFFDERFTTREAEDVLKQARMSRRNRDKRLDMTAAQIMLAAYLQSGPGAQQEPGPIEDP